MALAVTFSMIFSMPLVAMMKKVAMAIMTIVAVPMMSKVAVPMMMSFNSTAIMISVPVYNNCGPGVNVLSS